MKYAEYKAEKAYDHAPSLDTILEAHTKLFGGKSKPLSRGRLLLEALHDCVSFAEHEDTLAWNVMDISGVTDKLPLELRQYFDAVDWAYDQDWLSQTDVGWTDSGPPIDGKTWFIAFGKPPEKGGQ